LLGLDVDRTAWGCRGSAWFWPAAKRGLAELAHGRELSLDGAHLLVDGNGRGAVSEEQGEQVLTPVRVRHHARERAAARIGSVQQVHGPLLTGDADLDRELALTVVD
jgi:hypothetical protein